MHSPALITVIDHQQAPRHCHTYQGSPERLIPALADLLTWADDTHTPLTTDAYRAYATSHPHTLPTDEVTDPDDPTTTAPHLHYRYRLTLDPDNSLLELVATDLREHRVVATLGRANLYSTAAALCDLLAERGHTSPSDQAEPDRCRQAAADYRRRAHTTTAWAAATNLAADFVPASHLEPHPYIRIAGILVLAYLDEDAVLHVSIDLDETADRLVRPNGTVALRVAISGTDIFRD